MDQKLPLIPHVQSRIVSGSMTVLTLGRGPDTGLLVSGLLMMLQPSSEYRLDEDSDTWRFSNDCAGLLGEKNPKLIKQKTVG